MQWTEAIQAPIAALQPVALNQAVLGRLYSLVDLTSLNLTDTAADITALCTKAQSVLGHVAAVCVYPRFVRLAAAELLGSPVKVATVVNFPDGASALSTVLIDINSALTDGAEEIDVVFPYQQYLAGDKAYAHTLVAACRAACGEKVRLKVILETGVLCDYAMIAEASDIALHAGADFIKTSTGKAAAGATLEAVAVMLLVIKQSAARLARPVGLKVSGGVREVQQAAQYVELAERIMGKDWVRPQTFRLGASRLVDDILMANGG